MEESVLDMGKCEEPRAHPNGDIRCGVCGMKLRRASIWRGTRGLDGIPRESSSSSVLTQTRLVSRT